MKSNSFYFGIIGFALVAIAACGQRGISEADACQMALANLKERGAGEGKRDINAWAYLVIRDVSCKNFSSKIDKGQAYIEIHKNITTYLKEGGSKNGTSSGAMHRYVFERTDQGWVVRDFD